MSILMALTLGIASGVASPPPARPLPDPTLCLGAGPAFIPPTGIAAQDLYVAPSGDDANDCLTPATPCRTVQGAVDKATVIRAAVHIAAGVYTETVRGDGYVGLYGAGAGNTILDGGAAPGPVVDEVETIADLTVRGGEEGVRMNRGGILERAVVEASGGNGLTVESAYVVDSSIRGHAGHGIVVTLASHQLLRVSGSAIHRNGGAGIIRGLHNCEGFFDLRNSTVSGNSVGLDLSFDVVWLSHVTIASNPVGGLYTFSLPIRAGHTILADNGGTDCYVLNSGGYNVISDASGCTITGGGGTDLIGVDPLLGPLQDNGGPTYTHALLPGSPAIDSGSTVASDCPAVDQRGEARPADGDRDGIAVCDRGAFEVVRAGDLLRNDLVASIIGGTTPPLADIFTGRLSRCSVDPSVSLDAADPSGCNPRSEGEGAREAGNGSSDADDLYVVDFGWPGRPTPEPEPGILYDTRRPLVSGRWSTHPPTASSC